MRISDWSSDVCSSDLLQNKERSMRGLNGKVAIVTGATKAIGIATAERLGAEGVQVVGCGRDAESGERCAERIRENGGIAEFVHCDIGMEEQVRDVIAAAVSRFGRLDIVRSEGHTFELQSLMRIS